MTTSSEKNKKILVIEEVEDDDTLRDVLYDNFTSSGFKVLRARDGMEGLSMARKERPDLILLDLLLPKMGGIDMLRKLREDPKNKNIPVIIFSNYSDNDKIASAMELGANDYLVKSNWKLEDVMQKVKEKLGA